VPVQMIWVCMLKNFVNVDPSYPVFYPCVVFVVSESYQTWFSPRCFCMILMGLCTDYRPVGMASFPCFGC
jgi:hypothetical protein